MTTTSNYVPLVNGTGGIVVHGEIVRVSAANTFVRAQADSAPHLAGLIGVNGSGSIGVGGSANIFTTGALIDVLLETGLTLTPGQTVYVSSTIAGRGTNVPPGTAVVIGTIETTAQYVRTGIVQVAMALSSGGSGGTGPQGPQGAQGFQGVAGSGSQGNQGVQGAQGSQGATGTGSQGAQGAAGTGSQGSQGSQGTAGAQGAQGAQGSALANIATQTVLGNGSGGSAAPVALTITTATGLVADATTLKNTHAIGLAGGQTIIGDTLTAGNLTLRPNGADATTGDIRFIGAPSTTTMFISNKSGAIGQAQLVMGLSAPVSTLSAVEVSSIFNNTFTGVYAQNTSAGGIAAVNYAMFNGTSTAALQFHGNAFTTAGNVTAGTLMINIVNGTGNILSRLQQDTGAFVWETTTSITERFRIANDGSITWPITSKLGAFGAAAVGQQTVGANVNNVTASGTTGQFDNFTSLTVYASDAAAIHADIYQLARSVAQLTVAVRNFGLGN